MLESTRHNFLCKHRFLDKLNSRMLEQSVDEQLRSQHHCERSSALVHVDCTEDELIYSHWGEKAAREIGYGFEALAKLRKDISHSDWFIARSALLKLSSLMHDPEMCSQAVKINIIPRFVKTLRSENEKIVIETLECLRTISHHPQGLQRILDNKYIIQTIKDTINQPQSIFIQAAAAITVNQLAWRLMALDTLVTAGYVKEILKGLIRLKNSPRTGYAAALKNIMRLHFDTLDKLLEFGHNATVEAIAHDSDKLINFVYGTCITMRRASTAFFCQLAKHQIGKELLYRHDMIEPICKAQIEEEDLETKTNLTVLLQFATMHKEARKQAFRTGLFSYLLNKLTENDLPSKLKISIIILLTNFAELPEGKAILDTYYSSRVTLLIKLDGTPKMKATVQELVRVIKTKP